MATILVIDDDVDGATAVARYMGRAGHRAIVAANGRRALASLALSRPDAVILDMQMPQLDGVGFVKVLRGYFRNLGVPVAVLTGLPDGPKLDRIVEIGVRRIFRKGNVQMSELLEWVNQATRFSAPRADASDLALEDGSFQTPELQNPSSGQ